MSRVRRAMLAASKVPASDFIKVRIVADEARIESELAWLDLEHHQRIHYEGDLTARGLGNSVTAAS